MSNPQILIRQVLSAIPVGSLLQLDYEPVDGIRPEVREACAALGMSPTLYIVELTGSSSNSNGDPLLHGTVLNRDGHRRSFSLLRGKLRSFKILRHGPAEGVRS